MGFRARRFEPPGPAKAGHSRRSDSTALTHAFGRDARVQSRASMAAVTFRFGPYLADRTAYRVLRAGEVVELTPKLLDLLFHLLDHAGALVTKEDLLEALWPGANVTDNALSQAVSDLRHALDDDAGAPK